MNHKSIKMKNRIKSESTVKHEGREHYDNGEYYYYYDDDDDDDIDDLDDRDDGDIDDDGEEEYEDEYEDEEAADGDENDEDYYYYYVDANGQPQPSPSSQQQQQHPQVALIRRRRRRRRRRMSKRGQYTKRACINCRIAHAACDSGRPCKRCVQLGKTSTCIDAERKRTRKRGMEETDMEQQDKFYPSMAEYIPLLGSLMNSGDMMSATTTTTSMNNKATEGASSSSAVIVIDDDDDEEAGDKNNNHNHEKKSDKGSDGGAKNTLHKRKASKKRANQQQQKLKIDTEMLLDFNDEGLLHTPHTPSNHHHHSASSMHDNPTNSNNNLDHSNHLSSNNNDLDDIDIDAISPTSLLVLPLSPLSASAMISPMPQQQQQHPFSSLSIDHHQRHNHSSETTSLPSYSLLQPSSPSPMHDSSPVVQQQPTDDGPSRDTPVLSESVIGSSTMVNDDNDDGILLLDSNNNSKSESETSESVDGSKTLAPLVEQQLKQLLPSSSGGTTANHPLPFNIVEAMGKNNNDELVKVLMMEYARQAEEVKQLKNLVRHLQQMVITPQIGPYYGSFAPSAGLQNNPTKNT